MPKSIGKTSKAVTKSTDKSAARVNDFKSFDDVNLAEFPIAPLVKSTQDLKGKTDTVSFKMKVKNKKGEKVEKQFFYSREYGDIVPNNDTEDILLLLIYMLQFSEDKYTIHTSATNLLKLKGISVRPNQKQLQSVIRHLEALRQIRIETNFNFDLKNKRWRKAISSVIAGYSFTTIGEQTEVLNSKDEKEFQRQLGNIQRLDSISFAPEFINHFFDNPYRLDLNTYFSLQDPIPKRIYRYANKYLTIKGEEKHKDLWEFCWVNIGMRGKQVGEGVDAEDKYKNMKHIASKLKKHINRINDTGEFKISIERLSKKDKRRFSWCKSGYSITFYLPFPLFQLSNKSSYTNKEQRAYDEMRKFGIYEGAAKTFVVRYRKEMHTKGGDFILYSIKKTTEYITKKYFKYTSKFRNSKTPFGGIYYQAIAEEWFYDTYKSKEESQKERDKKETNALLGISVEGDSDFSNIIEVPKEAFDMSKFVQKHPQIHQKIKENREAYYNLKSAIFQDSLSEKSIAQMIQNAIKSYCKMCFIEFELGNTNFFPKMIGEDEE